MAVKFFFLVYYIINRIGLLKIHIFRRFFSKAYFTYKRYLEDSYSIWIENYRFLIEGGNVLDIGANIGYTASIFSNVISSGCQVFAFEPDPQNFLLLKENIKLRGLNKKIQPLEIAIGDRDGQTKFL